MSDNPTAFQFIDTNILVYAFDLTAEYKREIAKTLVEQYWETRTGCLSLQVLEEFYVNVTQKIPHPLNRGIARQLVSDLAYWRLHVPEVEDVLKAIDLQNTYLLSFWDAMILQSALRMRCAQLITEDLSHGKTYEGVQVVNPFA